MSLSVGIVGLPNVGKSTLFNALLKKQAAYAANFPFATIEPNLGVVPVPDERLETLAETIEKVHGTRPPIVPATVEFVDIAGLIAGAHKGEGLGNKFLHHIREVDAICHVLRAFKSEDIIREGSVAPREDFEIVKTELDLADYEMVEKHKKKKNADETQLPLFSKKPILIVLNSDETDLKNAASIEESTAKELGVSPDQVVLISAQIESDLAGLSEEEQKEYLQSLGVTKSGLERLIQKAYKTLGLISFLTAGEKEVRAWTIKQGTLAAEAAGVIHADFTKKFIKADIAALKDFAGTGWRACRELGKVRSEGRDYAVQDGDVVEFKIGS